MPQPPDVGPAIDPKELPFSERAGAFWFGLDGILNKYRRVIRVEKHDANDEADTTFRHDIEEQKHGSPEEKAEYAKHDYDPSAAYEKFLQESEGVRTFNVKAFGDDKGVIEQFRIEVLGLFDACHSGLDVVYFGREVENRDRVKDFIRRISHKRLKSRAEDMEQWEWGEAFWFSDTKVSDKTPPKA